MRRGVACHVTSCHLFSSHVMSCHVMLCHTASRHVVMSCLLVCYVSLLVSCHVMSHLCVSCSVSCLVAARCHVLLCHVASRLDTAVVSCLEAGPLLLYHPLLVCCVKALSPILVLFRRVICSRVVFLFLSCYVLYMSCCLFSCYVMSCHAVACCVKSSPGSYVASFCFSSVGAA